MFQNNLRLYTSMEIAKNTVLGMLGLYLAFPLVCKQWSNVCGGLVYMTIKDFKDFWLKTVMKMAPKMKNNKVLEANDVAIRYPLKHDSIPL